MNEEVKTIVSDALGKGAAMRDAQRAYFSLRTQEKLAAAKRAEAEFYEAMEAYTHGDTAAAVEECYDAILILLAAVSAGAK